MCDRSLSRSLQALNTFQFSVVLAGLNANLRDIPSTAVLDTQHRSPLTALKRLQQCRRTRTATKPDRAASAPHSSKLTSQHNISTNNDNTNPRHHPTPHHLHHHPTTPPPLLAPQLPPRTALHHPTPPTLTPHHNTTPNQHHPTAPPNPTNQPRNPAPTSASTRNTPLPTPHQSPSSANPI